MIDKNGKSQQLRITTVEVLLVYHIPSTKITDWFHPKCLRIIEHGQKNGKAHNKMVESFTWPTPRYTY